MSGMSRISFLVESFFLFHSYCYFKLSKHRNRCEKEWHVYFHFLYPVSNMALKALVPFKHIDFFTYEI